MIRVRVGPDAFDAGAEIAALSGAGVGGVATFIGMVRGEVGLVAMTLEHYPGMTERALEQLAADAATRWDLAGATVIHRVGRLVPGAPIVFVGTAAPHRAPALEACAFLIDRLKTDAPFWKREEFAGGGGRWVEARSSDETAALRWT